MTESKMDDDKIEEFLGELMTAQRDGFAWGFLNKGQKGIQNIQKLGKSAIEAASQLGIKSVYHCDRLLENARSDQERNFAMALVAHAPELMKVIKDERKVRKVLAGEGSDTCLWWTLSPYVFDELKNKMDEKEAVKKLLEWSRTGKPLSNVTNKEVNLSGLEMYNYAGRNCTFTLSKNHEGQSHKLARKEAVRIVQEVF